LPLSLHSQLVISPALDKPVSHPDDGIDVLDFLLGGIGVVHAQVAHAAKFSRDAEFRQMDLAWPMCR
jgi:hypothetical protein